MPVDQFLGNEDELVPDYYVEDEDGNIDYGATLLAYRARYDIARVDLASILDVSVSTVMGWEHGTRKPNKGLRRIIIDRLYLPGYREDDYEDTANDLDEPVTETSAESLAEVIPIGRPKQGLDGVIDAFLTRMEKGTPLTSAEARAFEDAFSAYIEE